MLPADKKKLRLLIVITVWAALSGLVVGGYWLTQRLAVGSARHALSYQEPAKDMFTQSTREACKNVNSGKTWISRANPRYIPDRNATSAKVYRYIVLEGETLRDTTCLNAIVAAAGNVPYSISMVFSDENGREIANFTFFKERK